MTQFLVRFAIGGLVVTIFAICGDILRPKSFAGLFGAAPSVALASLGLTFKQNGPFYVAIEAKSMMLGAVAFLAYVYLVGQLLKRGQAKALTVCILAMPVWFAISFSGLWLLTRFA
jgi:hypothetical protein